MSAAELDAIAALADGPAEPGATVAPGGAVLPPPPEPESPNYGPIGFILSAFRELAVRMLDVESPNVTLSEENVEKVAKALAPVADKYGLNLGTMMGGPEAMALMVAGPILWEAGRQLNAEMKAKRAKVVSEPKADPGDLPQASGAE